MPIARTIYYCQHCQRRRLMDRRKIEKHEVECWSNPENKSCPSCFYSGSSYVANEDTGNLKKVFDCCLGIIQRREVGENPPVNCSSWINRDFPEDEDGDAS